MSIEMQMLIGDFVVFMICVGTGFFIGSLYGYGRRLREEKDEADKVLQQEAREKRGTELPR